MFCTKFSHCGNFLASGGHDRLILIWDVFEPKVRNLGYCKGHKSAILDMTWDHGVEQGSSDPPRLHSCGADKQIISWDMADFSRIRSYRGHEDVVNSVDVSYLDQSQNMTSLQYDMLVSGSNDCTLKLWDVREKKYSASFKVGFQVTSVAFSNGNNLIFFAGIDNTIRGLNLRKHLVEYTLVGHTDTVTSISLSPSGNYLLSNAMDNTVRMWDVRPYTQNQTREERVFIGATHNFEKNLIKCCWSGDEKLVSAGSADRTVNVWEVESGNLKHRLGGHNGSVNETALHPNSSIIASASSDKTVWLGELGAESV